MTAIPWVNWSKSHHMTCVPGTIYGTSNSPPANLMQRKHHCHSQHTHECISDNNKTSELAGKGMCIISMDHCTYDIKSKNQHNGNNRSLALCQMTKSPIITKSNNKIPTN